MRERKKKKKRVPGTPEGVVQSGNRRGVDWGSCGWESHRQGWPQTWTLRPAAMVHFGRRPFVHFILSLQDYFTQMMKPLYSLFLPFLLTWSFSVPAASCSHLCTMAISHPLLLCMVFTGVTGKCAVHARPLVPPAPVWEQTQDCGALLGLIPDPRPTHVSGLLSVSCCSVVQVLC